MEQELGVHQLSFGREPFEGFPPPNSFLVSGTSASILIDAGWDNPDDHQSRLDYLKAKRAPDVIEMLVTHRHPDHAGGALALARELGVPISAHRLEVDVIESERFGGSARIDRYLEDGDLYDLGGLTLEVVFAPGHTLGCLAIHIRERNALITTDTVMGISTTVIRPTEGDLAAYSRTLERFLELDARTLYPGHGAPIHEARSRIESLIQHRLRREEQLLAALRDGPRSVLDLRIELYIGLPEPRVRLAEMQVMTGLLKLIADGFVQQEGDLYSLS